MLDPDGSYRVWTMLEAIEWKHLPDEGGLLDQDEALMNDLVTISFVSHVIEEEMKASKNG